MGALVALGLQGLIAVAAWSGSLAPYESEPTPQRPSGAPSDAVFADDFSNEDVWLVRDDASLSTQYEQGRYRMLVRKSESVWSSHVLLPNEVESMSVEVKARLDAGRAESDYYGVVCTDSSGASYFFGMAPDGYSSIAFDAGGDREIEIDRLIEKRNPRFSAAGAWNSLGAVCTPRGADTSLRLTVNGRTVAETTHRHSTGKLVAVELFAFSRAGGTEVLFDDVVVRDATR